MELPGESDLETAKSTYRNGILKISFNKRIHPNKKASR